MGGDRDQLHGVTRWRSLAQTTLRSVGMLLAVTSVIWYVNVLRRQINQFESVQFDGRALAAIILGIALYPLIYGAGATVWTCALRAIGARITLPTATSICAIAQFGKYLPGNFAHHLGRVFLARDYGIPTESVFVSMLIETVNLVMCGSLIASVALVHSSDVASAHSQYVPSTSQLIAVAMVGAAVLVAAVYSIGFTRKRWKGIRSVKPKWLLVCAAVQTIVFLLHGVIAYVLLRGVFHVTNVSLTAVTGMFAIAWIAGFLTPAAPAGIGVREAVISLTLGPIAGTAAAVGLAAIMRVVSTLGDGLTFGLGLLVGRESATGQHATTPLVRWGNAKRPS